MINIGIPYREALENRLISKSTYDILPRKCKCGSENQLSDSMTKIQCTNEECNYTLICRIQKFLDMIGIKIDTSDTKKIIKKYKIITPYQLLMLDRVGDIDIGVNSFNDIKEKIKELKNNEMYLYEIIELCGIKKVQLIAKKVAFGFNSIESLYDEITVGQVAFLNDRLGIYTSEACSISTDIYIEFLKLQEELVLATQLLKVKQHENTLNIAFCDSIYPYMNKGELIDYLNYKFKYTFVHRTTIDDTIDVLIRYSDSVNTKYRNARLLNDKFIAEQINKGNIQLADVGTQKDGEIKGVGNTVYIGTLEELMNKLESIQ